MAEELKLPKDEVKRIEAELEEKDGDKSGTHTPSEHERKLVELAVKRYEKYHEDFSDEITLAKDDISFCVDGKHWVVDGKDLEAERKLDDRLSFVKNRAPGFIDNVTGEVRQNMPRIKFRPLDSKTDPKMADIYNAAIKYMESISRAHRQYIPAFEQAATAGYPGWCQLITDYATDDPLNDEQDIFIKFIPSQFGPALDPSATTLDEPRKGGPKWGIVPEKISWADYIERFPDATVKSWDAIKNEGNTWYKQDGLTIGSYYVAVPEKEIIYKLPDGTKISGSSEEYKAFRKENPDSKLKKHREFTKYRIDHYLINGTEVLEGPEPWPGKFIPIIPFEGKWFMDDGKKKYRSVYRLAKDTNRQENFMASTITELLADEPYMATPEMIGDHEDMWKARNKKKYGVLYYKHDQNAPGGRPTKEDNSAKLTGAFNMTAQLVDDGKALANIFNASRGEASNETSGRAINARDQQSNTTNYAFVDNGIVSPLEYIAIQFIDLFPKIYDYEMTLKIMGEDGTEKGEVTINSTEPGIGEEGVGAKTVHVFKDKKGNVTQKFYADLSHVRFDLTVDVGPGFKTQRMEALDQSIRMSQGNQIFAEASAPQTAKLLDFPDSDRIAKRAEFMLNLKYPGIDQVGEEENNEQAKVQMAVKQAVDQVQQQSMQAFQAAETKIQELMGAVQQLQADKAQATQAMKDKAAEIELKQREMALKEREFEFKSQSEGERSQWQAEHEKSMQPIMQEVKGLRKMVEEITGMLDKATDELVAVKSAKPEAPKPEAKSAPSQPQNLTVVIDNGGKTVKKTVSLKTPEGKEYKGEVEESINQEPAE